MASCRTNLKLLSRRSRSANHNFVSALVAWRRGRRSTLRRKARAGEEGKSAPRSGGLGRKLRRRLLAASPRRRGRGRLRRLSGRRWRLGRGRSGRGDDRIFAVREPDVVDRMLDRMQARARREHPTGEDALDVALQRHFVDLDEGVGVGGLGRRAGVADPRRHLQRAELYGLADGGIEGDDAAGDLVETGEHGRLVGDLLRRRLGDDLIARLRRGIGGLRGAARLALARRIDRRGGALGRRQWLRLHAPRRGLPRLPRIGLIRILLLLRIALVGITLVGIALVRILRIALLGAAAGHARGWTWGRPKKRFERVEELRRRGRHAERRPCRDRRGDEAGDAKQSGHRTVLEHGRAGLPVNTENTAGKGPFGGRWTPASGLASRACSRRSPSACGLAPVSSRWGGGR